MAGTGQATANNLLLLMFQATTWATVAINATSSPLTNLYWSLNTADPTTTGNQSSSEVAYTSYARTAGARTSGGFTITNNVVNPAATVAFPAGTGGGPSVAADFTVGVGSSGATALWFCGTVTPSIICQNGVTPQLTTASSITLN